jgi:hypothetical protein
MILSVMTLIGVADAFEVGEEYAGVSIFPEQ